MISQKPYFNAIGFLSVDTACYHISAFPFSPVDPRGLSSQVLILPCFLSPQGFYTTDCFQTTGVWAFLFAWLLYNLSWDLISTKTFGLEVFQVFPAPSSLQEAPKTLWLVWASVSSINASCLSYSFLHPQSQLQYLAPSKYLMIIA